MVNASAKKPGAFDAFLHLLTYVALGLSTVAVGAIVFHFIDRWFPTIDRAAYDYGYGEPSATGALRFTIASLLLAGPLLLILTGYKHRLFGRNQLDPSSGVRRWLTYFVLFVAAVNIIGSVISLVYQFLGGNYTANFILKAATVLVIAAVVFGFYFWELRRIEYRQRNPWAVATLLGVAVLFAGLLVGGFALIGSPLTARKYEFDQRRVDAAMQVRWQVEEEYRRVGAVPQALEALAKIGADFTVGRDPETNTPFGYEQLADNRYQLCVEFALRTPRLRSPRSAPVAPMRKPYGERSPEGVWYEHGAGRECHTFTLTKRSLEEGVIDTEVDQTTLQPTSSPVPRQTEKSPGE